MIGNTSGQVNLQRPLSGNPTQVATGISWPDSDHVTRRYPASKILRSDFGLLCDLKSILHLDA